MYISFQYKVQINVLEKGYVGKQLFNSGNLSSLRKKSLWKGWKLISLKASVLASSTTGYVYPVGRPVGLKRLSANLGQSLAEFEQRTDTGPLFSPFWVWGRVTCHNSMQCALCKEYKFYILKRFTVSYLIFYLPQHFLTF